MKNNRSFTKPISWLFLLYFVILFAERAQSLVRVVAEVRLFASGFAILVDVTALLSLFAAVIMLVFRNKRFWLSLFSAAEPDYSVLTITSGVILISGMVHTEYTIPPVQFAAYGALILAMILRTAELSGRAKSRAPLWYSLAYLTAFSMAIPVMYALNASDSLAFETAFYVLEAVVMLLLVLSFTVMLRRMFLGQGENLLLWIPFLIMAIGDTAVLWMRWADEINFFVLIFAAVSAVLFLIGKSMRFESIK